MAKKRASKKAEPEAPLPWVLEVLAILDSAKQPGISVPRNRAKSLCKQAAKLIRKHTDP